MAKGSGVIVCAECGERFYRKKLEECGLTRCPTCGAKHVLRRKPAGNTGNKRRFSLNCFCGASYKIEPPAGEFRFECKRCGRLLLSIRPRSLNGVDLPRYIERVAENQ